MAILPLSSDGLATKLKQLYKLHQPDRELLADILIDDFRKYVIDNFSLTAEEHLYLEQLDPFLCNYIGSQCALCLRYKLPIEIYNVSPSPNAAPISTTTMGNEILISSVKGTEKMHVEEKLKFTICRMHNN